MLHINLILKENRKVSAAIYIIFLGGAVMMVVLEEFGFDILDI